jgi:NADH-quinone oxidoreductase subunit M
MILESLPLSSILMVPALGALVCLGPWFTNERDPSGRLCKGWAIFVCAVVSMLVFAVATTAGAGSESFMHLEEYHSWIPSLGISLHLTFDGLSAGFCILTALMSMAVVTWSYAPEDNRAGWYAMLLSATAAVLGSFLSTDLVAFYVFYELMLLPVLAGIAVWGGDERKRAVFRFLMYTVSGSVLMLVAIVYLGWHSSQVLQPHSGVTDFAFTSSTLASLPPLPENVQLILCAAFLFAFGIKVPVVPLHGWLVDTYRQAPSGLVAFIAALLGKVGVYGIVRFVLPIFPDAMSTLGPAIVALGAIGIASGALMAWAQRDIRSMLAYSSLSHLGFCIVGIGVASTMSISGAVFQAISHGFVTGGLFLVFGMVAQTLGSDRLDDFGGLASRFPRIAFYSMVFTIGAVALPLTSGFVGEFLVLISAWERYPAWTLVSGFGIVIGAVYMLRAYRYVMLGDGPRLDVREARDARGLDIVVLSSFAVAVFLLGVAPGKVLEAVEGAISIGGVNATNSGRARLGSFETVSYAIDSKENRAIAVTAEGNIIGTGQSASTGFKGR